MPVVKPNTQDMVDLSPIEPGSYLGKITEVTLTKSKEKQQNMLETKFELIVNGKPRPRTTYLMLEGKGTFGFDQLLRALNMAELADKYKAGDGPDFDTDTLINQECLVIVSEEINEKTKQLGDRITGYLKK